MADNKDKKVLNVPALRFPEFIKSWECSILEKLSKKIGDGIHSTPSYDDNGTFYFINGNNLNGGKIVITSSTKRVSEKEAYKNNAENLEANSILMSINGTIGNVALYHNEPIMLGKSACYINSKDNIDKNYLFYYLQYPKTQLYFEAELTGTTIKNLSLQSIRKTKIYIPTIEEQHKISRFLQKIDERISTQNKIIEDLKKLKSAISKQAFAQKPNGWNRLDTLFSKGKAGGTPTSTNKEYYNGEIPFLSINDITKQGKYVRYTENHLSRSGLENSSAWVVPEYSLIISMYASVGLVTINEVPITTSQAMFAMQLRDKDLLDYLYYYLSYFKYRHIHKYLETGTQSNINADIVRGIMIPTYGHSRNMKIASTLQGIDAKIDNELSVLKLFNRQKNYLLSQMFI